MLYHAKLPQHFWAEAVSTAVYLHNCSSTTALSDKTLFECWFDRKPDVSNLKVFGCLSYAHNAIEPIVHQVQPVLTEQLVVNSEPVGATYEETFMCQMNALGPQRQQYVPQRFHPDSCFVTKSLTSDIIEPKSVKEALNSEHSVQWKNAMSSEYSSLIKNDTWELVPPSNDKNIVGSKWVLKVKRNQMVL